MKDEYGHFAVFSEQGASASHLASSKFMDTIALFPGNFGEDSDAISAYTQVKLADVPELLGATSGKEIHSERGFHFLLPEDPNTGITSKILYASLNETSMVIL